MFRIIRNPRVGHIVEFNINGRRSVLDLSAMSNKEKTQLSQELFDWRKDGYKGYPSCLVNS